MSTENGSKSSNDPISLIECDHCGEMRECREYAALGEVICGECWAWLKEHRGPLTECEECGAEVFELDLEYVQTQRTLHTCEPGDDCPDDGITVCPDCFRKYDPERLEAMRELADEARAEHMREMREAGEEW